MPKCEAIFAVDCTGEPDCMNCVEWLATCDRCHCGGHTDSDGWRGIENEDGQPRVLCEDCYEIETSN